VLYCNITINIVVVRSATILLFMVNLRAVASVSRSVLANNKNIRQARALPELPKTHQARALPETQLEHYVPKEYK
jgi:hypothetical protein